MTGVLVLELACALHFTGIHYPKAVNLAAEAGFRGLEVSPWLPRRLNDTDIRRLGVLLRKKGLGFSGFTSIYPPEITLAAPSATARRKSIIYTQRLIELVHGLNGRTLVWGSPRSRNIPVGVPYEKGYTWLIELLKTSGALADRRGVSIAIEPINRFESTIIHNAKEALQLLRLANHKSIGIVYDIFHASLEEESLTEPIFLAGKRLAAVHISDCNRKIPGRGHLDFRPVFSALKKVGYNGYVTLESILGHDLKGDLIAARRCLEKSIV